MGRGEEYRDVYLREMSTLSRNFLSKPVPDSDGFQERVGRQVRPVLPGFVESTRRAEGILDQYFLASHAGKGRVVTRRFGIVSFT